MSIKTTIGIPTSGVYFYGDLFSRKTNLIITGCIYWFIIIEKVYWAKVKHIINYNKTNDLNEIKDIECIDL